MTSIRPNRSVSRVAMAPGVMSMATTSSAPTACKVATVASESITSNAPCSNRVGRPTERACCGSKQ